MEENKTQPYKPSLNVGADANAEGGTNNTDTSLNGEYRAGAGIYVNASGEWTDPNGNVLRGEALMKAEANASAKYGVTYRDDNLYIEAVAEAKLRAEVSLKAEIESGNHAAGVELYAYAELYAWAGGEANVGTDGCWFEGGAIAGAKAGAGTKTYYTNESLGVAATNNTSVSAGAQVGGTIGGGYQVPDWNKDSKPITIGGSINLALIVGVKTEGTVTVDVDPVYDMGEDMVGDNVGVIDDVKEGVVDNVVAPIQEVVEPVKAIIAPIAKPITQPIQDASKAIGGVFGGKKKKKKKGWF
ncbi:hypothetical protein N9981_00035 [bacterium]|nr:hypothetical protein [Schleiferiaceae bacterium]MDB4319734.1 hypothetical protein [bacterium]